MIRTLLRRLCWWLAVPVTVLAALALGHLALTPDLEIEANQFDEILQRAPIEKPKELNIHFTLPDGQPAVGATVVLLEPELSIAHTDQDGRAQLAYLGNSPFRLQAYLPDHELMFAGPSDLETIRLLQFERRKLFSLPLAPPVVLVEQDFLMLDGTGEPIPGVLIKALPMNGDQQVPWLAFSKSDGWARLEGLPIISFKLEAYTPELPLNPAWKLGEREILPKDEAEAPWTLQVAQLILESLPPGEVLEGARVDLAADLPLLRIPANGTVRYPFLPAGRYTFRVNERSFDLDLVVGANQFTLP
jgi:hypothetical protein